MGLFLFRQMVNNLIYELDCRHGLAWTGMGGMGGVSHSNERRLKTIKKQ